MLQTLDPHSSFMDPRTYAQMRERQEGRYYGLGITIAVVDGEITVVTRPERLSELDVLTVHPDRWALFAIDCANPFSCPGFLAKLAAAFCEEGLDVMMASTFSRDLLFVHEREREHGRQILLATGVREGGSATADA